MNRVLTVAITAGITITASSLLLVSCNSSSSNNDDSLTPTSQLSFPTTVASGAKGAIRPVESETTYNAEAVIPPQCYTKHDNEFNPCMTCHQTYDYRSRPNSMNDGGLQQEYAFSDVGLVNHWSNLFEDRSQRMAEISDQDAIDYIYTDNYSTLIEQLQETSDWSGPIPAIDNYELGAEAFDEQGFALDGSHWVAFNYKPLPSTFWPTNGSTDDVLIKLPEAFRTSACQGNMYSKDTYLANLSILEAAIKDLDTISVPNIDENAFCTDLNGDNQLTTVSEITVPAKFVGAASEVDVVKMLYPEGTQFLHSVRYVGINEQGDITVPPRMKELRYMKKFRSFSEPELVSMYINENQEKIDGLIPNYIHRGDEGTDNSFGWMVQGFIEGEGGHLRLQSEEEHLFCMGCHTTVGSTVDQTFAFARKVTGSEGWGYINLKGMKDAPNIDNTTGEGEIEHYLRVVGGGNEFRENDDIISKFFNADGTLNTDAVRSADVYELTTPSMRRALDLNKAYMTIVKDQDFIHGRDANLKPANNVHTTIDQDTPVLPGEKTQTWDMRLDWDK